MTGMLKVMLAIMLISGLLLVGCQPVPEPKDPANPGAAVGAPEIGKLAPDLQLRNLAGDVVSLGGLRGKPVMLNFWATWCPPCRDEMPYLQRIYEEWTSRGLIMLTVNIGEEAKQVAAFLKDYKLSLPTLLDTKQSVAEKYNIRAIPTTFFIDTDGIIQRIKIGAFRNKAEIEEYLGSIIAR